MARQRSFHASVSAATRTDGATVAAHEMCSLVGANASTSSFADAGFDFLFFLEGARAGAGAGAGGLLLERSLPFSSSEPYGSLGLPPVRPFFRAFASHSMRPDVPCMRIRPPLEGDPKSALRIASAAVLTRVNRLKSSGDKVLVSRSWHSFQILTIIPIPAACEKMLCSIPNSSAKASNLESVNAFCSTLTLATLDPSLSSTANSIAVPCGYLQCPRMRAESRTLAAFHPVPLRAAPEATAAAPASR